MMILSCKDLKADAETQVFNKILGINIEQSMHIELCIANTICSYFFKSRTQACFFIIISYRPRKTKTYVVSIPMILQGLY